MERVVKVEMLALGKAGRFRDVTIDVTPGMPLLEKLNSVWRNGQNEVQPHDTHVSVSIGDVIELGGERYVIVSDGFHRLLQGEYEVFLRLQPVDRYFASSRLGTKVL